MSLETNGQGDIAPTKEVASHLAIVDSSDGQRAIENMLKRYYEPMEEWYLRTSIEKVCTDLPIVLPEFADDRP